MAIEYEEYDLGNIRGLPGIPGDKGEKGDPADVTGQALFDTSVEHGFTGTYDDWLRAYLGAAVTPDLPWCSGTFQDRTLLANDWTYVTPVPLKGDFGLINNEKFIVPQKGRYILLIFGGRSSTPTPLYTSIWRNHTPSGGWIEANAIYAEVINSSANSHSYTNAFSAGEFDSGEYLTCVMASDANQPTMHNGPSLKFYFAQLA